jgi:hypothetical protein
VRDAGAVSRAVRPGGSRGSARVQSLAVRVCMQALDRSMYVAAESVGITDMALPAPARVDAARAMGLRGWRRSGDLASGNWI